MRDTLAHFKRCICERFAALGADTVASMPDEFASFTRAEYEKFARLVKAANIQPE